MKATRKKTPAETSAARDSAKRAARKSVGERHDGAGNPIPALRQEHVRDLDAAEAAETRAKPALEPAPPPVSPSFAATFHANIDAMRFELPISIEDMLAARDVLRDALPKGTVLDVYFKPAGKTRIAIVFSAQSNALSIGRVVEVG